MNLSRTSTVSLLAACALALAGCYATTESTAAPEPAPRPAVEKHKAITTSQLEPYECGTITRLHTFDGIFLASQPKPADFEQAKDGGVRTVVNMRHSNELDFDEGALVDGLGLEYVHEPWNGADELTDEVFHRYRQILATAERPILLHCGSANRVGAIWLAWRALDDGLTTEEALDEAKVVGLKSPVYEELALDYVERMR